MRFPGFPDGVTRPLMQAEGTGRSGVLVVGEIHVSMGEHEYQDLQRVWLRRKDRWTRLVQIPLASLATRHAARSTKESKQSGLEMFILRTSCLGQGFVPFALGPQQTWAQNAAGTSLSSGQSARLDSTRLSQDLDARSRRSTRTSVCNGKVLGAFASHRRGCSPQKRRSARQSHRESRSAPPRRTHKTSFEARRAMRFLWEETARSQGTMYCVLRKGALCRKII